MIRLILMAWKDVHVGDAFVHRDELDNHMGTSSWGELDGFGGVLKRHVYIKTGECGAVLRGYVDACGSLSKTLGQIPSLSNPAKLILAPEWGQAPLAVVVSMNGPSAKALKGEK